VNERENKNVNPLMHLQTALNMFLAAAENFEFLKYNHVKVEENKVHAVHHKDSKNFVESLVHRDTCSAAAKNKKNCK